MKEPKKKIEIVFYLIQRMSRAEKRYFKLYNQIYKGKDTAFVKLFNLLNEMKEYDADKVKVFWKKEKIQRKSVCVAYLLDKVTETMYSVGNNELLTIKNLIQPHLNAFHVYYRLQLFKLAYNELSKAEQIADKYEVSNVLFEIYELKYHMIGVTNFNEKICESEVTIKNKCSRSLKKFVHNENLIRILFKIYKADETNLETAYQELITYERYYDEFSVLCKMHFNACHNQYHYKKNSTQGIVFMERNIKLFEDYPHFISHQLNDYLACWHNRLITGLDEEHIDLTLKYYERHRSLPQKHKEIFDNLPINSEISYRLSGLQFGVSYAIRYGQYDEIEQINQKVKQIFEKEYTFSIYSDNVQSLLLRFAYCNLLIKNYSEGEYWTDKLLNISYLNPLIAEEAQVLKLLFTYEKCNESLLISNIRRLERQWKITPPVSPNVLHILKLLQKSLLKRQENNLPRLFKIAYENACQLENTKDCYIFFSRWIALKI